MFKILKNKYKEILMITAVYLVTHLLISYFRNGQIEGDNVIRNTIIVVVSATLGTLFWNKKKVEKDEVHENNNKE
ncbi:hypothetical protein SAMN02745249_01960 [Atopostipes suicloacalis DSM 15692]|uniref:Uncharacterized protein n=1 Tax=Atopostipes suicloacalis DSM 15692 TaxID=1121025 RepID=A0A1M4ZGM2_9LACT|nr:hypothetical protein [Atopostipes suicloacalis]SHF17194.1 hypothetical protein SAMN02745249_01960 [Atopostipes suicloacalis DSM 15692]